MRFVAPVALAVFALGAAVSGCTCDDPAPRSQPAPPSAVASVPASASAAPERVPRPTRPAPKPDAFEVTTSDGVHIKGSEWSGGDASAPAVVLVHRMAGSRAEWTPLVERLLPPKHPMNVVAFDLRGHGESKKASKHPKATKGQIAWQQFDNKDFEQMIRDVTAVLEHLRERKGGPPSQWVLVGSDIGATLAVRASAHEQVAGVALVSPGAGLRGMDLYHPFVALRDRPNLIIAGTQDNVSRDAARTLGAMSKGSKLVTFDEREHSAQFLGDKRWEVWDELADWIEARVQPRPAMPASSASASSSSVPAAGPASSGR